MTNHLANKPLDQMSQEELAELALLYQKIKSRKPTISTKSPTGMKHPVIVVSNPDEQVNMNQRAYGTRGWQQQSYFLNKESRRVGLKKCPNCGCRQLRKMDKPSKWGYSVWCYECSWKDNERGV
jgi:hypothetical protein